MSESEQTSLERYAGTRDAGAFRMLVERHQDMVFATCRRILRNPADAEDAAQNCFLQLASKAGQLRAPIAGWLHRVAVQASIDMLRRDQARKGREMRAAQGRAEDPAPSWDEVKGFVDEAMAGLPDRVRLPLILHYLEGRKQTEIAAELGITQSAVSKRLQQGVNVLRGQLKRGGFIFSAGVLAPLLVNNAAEAAPATLKAALGKMALSGMGATKATATAGTATAGGLTVVKSVIAVAAVSAITVGSVVAYKTMSGDAAPPPSKVQAPARQTAKPRPIVGPGAAVEKPPRPVKSLDLRIYDVRDVLLMSEKTGRAEGRSGPRSRTRRIRLLKLIVQLTGAENWRSVCLESREGRSEKVGEVGEGAGLMVLREADLLVKQRDQVHKHIELIITALREQGLVQVNMAAKFISLSGQFIKEFDRPGSRRSSVPRLLSNLLSKRRKPSAGASGSATTFSEILDEATAKELVNAARKSPHARILQEPSVTTLNGEPAPVGVRSKIEFISSWKGGGAPPDQVHGICRQQLARAALCVRWPALRDVVREGGGLYGDFSGADGRAPTPDKRTP